MKESKKVFDLHVKYLTEALDIQQTNNSNADAFQKEAFIFIGEFNMRETKLLFDMQV